MPSVNLDVAKQIGENFQEVGFTASEEARNPDAHHVGRAGDSALIAGEEIPEMLFQFSGDDIFLQLLTNIGVVILSDFDNALDVAI